MSEQAAGAVLLGRYQIDRELARGGFGVVYRAHHLETQQPVAIKRLLTDEANQLQRFDREMKLTSKLKSPHTVRLVDYGNEDGNPIMVLEFVEGESLYERLERGPISPAETRHIMIQVLQSLAEAHQHGIVHRDLKPGNIMLSGQGLDTHVKLLDFGTAGVVTDFQDQDHQKITRAGEIQGTPAYMPPEQVLDFADATTQSDLYALGLIIFECLTGRQAFTAPSPAMVCAMQVKNPLVLPPNIASGHFAPIIMRASAKRVEERYPSADYMCIDIEKIDLSKPPAATTAPATVDSAPTPASTTQGSNAGPNNTMLIMIALVCLILAGVMAVVFLM